MSFFCVELTLNMSPSYYYYLSSSISAFPRYTQG